MNPVLEAVAKTVASHLVESFVEIGREYVVLAERKANFAVARADPSTLQERLDLLSQDIQMQQTVCNQVWYLSAARLTDRFGLQNAYSSWPDLAKAILRLVDELREQP